MNMHFNYLNMGTFENQQISLFKPRNLFIRLWIHLKLIENFRFHWIVFLDNNIECHSKKNNKNRDYICYKKVIISEYFFLV